MDSSTLGDKILEGTYDAFQWDWYVEPDPDGILGRLHLRPAAAGLNDSWYCDEGYDAMYAAAEPGDGPGQAGRDRPADAAAALRGRALHRHGLHRASARRSATTGSPASSRSPTRAGSG